MRPGLNKISDGLYFQMPDFIHKFGPGQHSRPGALHAAIDRPLYAYYKILNFIGDACPVADLLKVLQIIGFGLNCGFPAKDVALYVVWYLRGCKPVKVWKKSEGNEA